MTIPIGKDYTFTLQVLKPNSFEPLDVTGYSGGISVFRQDDYTIKPIDDVSIVPVEGSEADGLVTGTIAGTLTSTIVIPETEKGDPADYSYVMSRYAGFIYLGKAGVDNVNVTVPAVSFVFAG